MKLTIDSGEPLDVVLRAVGGLYGVTLTTTETTGGTKTGTPPDAQAAPSPRRRAGRQAPNRRSAKSSTTSAVDPKVVRAWATENGLEVSSRGALSSALRDAYLAAHPA